MIMLTTDTLAHAKRLKEAGTDQKLAESLASEISEAGRELAIRADLTTGLTELKESLTHRFDAGIFVIPVVMFGMLRFMA